MDKQKKWKNQIAVIALILLIAVAAIGVYTYVEAINPKTTMPIGVTKIPTQHLIVSSTTSLYETGFLDALKASFEKEYPHINVSFLSQGTGLAIQTAMRGDADMIFVHDPGQELTFLTGGYGVNRKVVAYNFFVIVGPPSDPAGIRGLAPLDAFKKIEAYGDNGSAVWWVSRGDGSGTHSKEKNLWKAAGFNVTILRTHTWYLERGSGMTDTLMLANEKEGYTLTDLASYLNNYNKGNIQLEIMVNESKDLLNVYSVIAGDPRNNNLTKANFNASMTFINFVVSDAGQQLFADYGKATFGKPLFAPYIPLLTAGGVNDTMVKLIQKYAYFNGTECPPAYRYQAGNLYSAG